MKENINFDTDIHLHCYIRQTGNFPQLFNFYVKNKIEVEHYNETKDKFFTNIITTDYLDFDELYLRFQDDCYS